MLRINDTVPNFNANSTQGKIDFHKFIDNSWAVLFSHPKDFTPVCTTELGYMASIQEEFKKRGETLDKQKETELKRLVDESYNNPEKLSREIARLFGLEHG